MSNRILLVDDDLSVREALTHVLMSEGYEVVPAADGREAVGEFRRTAPDLVLLDLSMPQRDGWHAFDQMSQHNPWVPVIVITARPNQAAHASGAGVDALMEKPLDLAVLLGKIEELLREAKKDRMARLSRADFATERLCSATPLRR